MMNPLLFTAGMTESQRLTFLSEFNRRRKDRLVALLLALFLGGFGAHRFYMGQIGLGFIYLLLCWTLVPTIVAFLELFFIMGRVDRRNEQVALDLAYSINSAAAVPEIT